MILSHFRTFLDCALTYSWNRIYEKCKVTLCGMKNINLTKESINILGVNISYNNKIQDDLNFSKTIKIKIFKSLATSNLCT